MARPAVDLNVDRVPSVTCARCARAVDTSQAKPLHSLACPGCGAPIRVPGRIGQFLLTRMLGRGAMGAVFEGVDEELGRRVAIKVLTPRKDEDDALRMNDLLAEARALARINHPNVVQIHSVGQHRDQPYIVMELIGGGPKLEDYAAGRATLGEPQALELLVAVAEGLGVAAKAHLVHGDIKPQNILLNAQGVAKVVDFGLTQKVRLMGGSTVWGTPYYIPPERARGGPCDTRADIFSLGATVWHLLAGRPPYDGKTVKEVVAARLKVPPPDLREVRADIHVYTADLLKRMMATKPGERPGSFDRVAEEARHVLDTLLHDASDALASLAASSGNVPRQPAPRPARVRKKARKGLAIPTWGFILIGAVAISLGLYFGWPFGNKQETTPTPPPKPDRVRSADEPFDGPALPNGWTMTGATFNGAGQLVLETSAIAADLPQVVVPIGGGSFAATVDLGPLDWSLNLKQAVTLRFSDGPVEMVVSVEKDNAQNPAVILAQRGTANDPPPQSHSQPFDPDALTLWVGWDETEKRWSIASGLDSARPRLLGTLTAPGPSTPGRRLTVTAEAQGTSGMFTAALDRIQLDPTTPKPPPR